MVLDLLLLGLGIRVVRRRRGGEPPALGWLAAGDLPHLEPHGGAPRRRHIDHGVHQRQPRRSTASLWPAPGTIAVSATSTAVPPGRRRRPPGSGAAARRCPRRRGRPRPGHGRPAQGRERGRTGRAAAGRPGSRLAARAASARVVNGDRRTSAAWRVLRRPGRPRPPRRGSPRGRRPRPVGPRRRARKARAARASRRSPDLRGRPGAAAVPAVLEQEEAEAGVAERRGERDAVEPRWPPLPGVRPGRWRVQPGRGGEVPGGRESARRRSAAPTSRAPGSSVGRPPAARAGPGANTKRALEQRRPGRRRPRARP